jgi:hypothetical protein
MRLFLSLAFFALVTSFSAQETINYPYNPDGNSDGFIAVPDLQDLLSTYGSEFSPGEIQIDGVNLSDYLTALNLVIEGNALPEGTSFGQFLRWNGAEWEIVMPKVGCSDLVACNYDETANVLDEDKCIYQDACGVCDGPGEIYECGCSDTPEGDCDCDGNQLDALNVCGGECAADEDGDGICDDGDSCIGEADECGVCNGPGAIYDCGCTEPAPETCDCDGNVVDAVGVCGGGCQEDADADGICDSQDDCVGEFDDCGVCNGPGPILGCGCNNIPEGDCDCQGNQLDAVGTCGGACQTDVNGDGVCDDDSIPGCTYSVACNYDPSASINDGSCDFTTCYGCTDIAACNYSAAAIFDNQSCWYASFALDCEYNCLNDSDGDGYCDELETYGCTDTEACNYEVGATELDESCLYVDECGICGGEGTLGCTDSTACNFDPEAVCDDESCVEEGDVGCIDSIACNFDETAICGDDSCTYEGCTNPLASNYDETAGCDDGSCIVYGCMVDLACNYELTANIDDASCEFGNCPGCNNSGADNYNPTSTNDEICEYSYTFTNCGQEGRFGPSIEQLIQEYGAGSGITVIDGIQHWTVPASGTCRIEAFGAQGGAGQGYTGGLGAMMGGYVSVTEGETLKILVGQKGGNSSYAAGGGGGGSFVTDANNNPLVIAGGGGGGGGNNTTGNGNPGLITTSGGNSNYYTGGSDGSGGGAGSGSGGGGGLLSDGVYANTSGGSSFVNGGAGSPGGGCTAGGGSGGFGGGSGGEWCQEGAPGAGGGYSGGAGTNSNGLSGGGGSYNSGTSQDNESGINEGHGRVFITFIPAP